MENKESNKWRQEERNDTSDVREGKSSLDDLNEENAKREQGDWKDNVSKGNGDYGSEEGRSDAGVTGGETDISRPYTGDDRIIPGGVKNSEEQPGDKTDEWNAQHPGELPV